MYVPNRIHEDMPLYRSTEGLAVLKFGFGVNVGPITSTTRGVYVRKYKALLAEQKSAPPKTTPHVRIEHWLH